MYIHMYIYIYIYTYIHMYTYRTQHSAELMVSVVKPNLSWTYQIQGVAEAPMIITVIILIINDTNTY